MDAVPLVALEREWRTLVRGQLAAEFRRWAAAEPALIPFDGPARLIAFLRDERASAEVKDRVLGAVLARAGEEPLAARLVLEAMLPGLKRQAGQLLRRRPEREGESALAREELWQVLFLSLLERIKTYPLERRPRKIAANLLSDTLHATLAELRRARAAREELPQGEPLEPAGESPWPSDVEAPLRRAVVAGAISEAEAELIIETEVEGVPLREVARRLGITYNAVKIRRQRAERRLLVFLGHPPDPGGRSKRPSSGAYAPEARTLRETA